MTNRQGAYGPNVVPSLLGQRAEGVGELGDAAAEVAGREIEAAGEAVTSPSGCY